MPQVRVVFYTEEGKSAPVLDWLDAQPRKILDKFTVRIERLAELGHELRRPEADTLRDGIHELRVRYGSVNYRILYFFHKEVEVAAILAHSLTKEDRVPDKEIEVALRRKEQFEDNPLAHTLRNVNRKKPTEGENDEG